MCAVALDLKKRNKKLTPKSAAVEAAAELGLFEDHKDIDFAETQVAAWLEVCNEKDYPCSLCFFEIYVRHRPTLRLHLIHRMLSFMYIQGDGPSEMEKVARAGGRGRKRKGTADTSAEQVGKKGAGISSPSKKPKKASIRAEDGDAAEDLEQFPSGAYVEDKDILDDEDDEDDSEPDDGAVHRRKKRRRKKRRSSHGHVSPNPNGVAATQL